MMNMLTNNSLMKYYSFLKERVLGSLFPYLVIASPLLLDIDFLDLVYTVVLYLVVVACVPALRKEIFIFKKDDSWSDSFPFYTSFLAVELVVVLADIPSYFPFFH